MKPYTIIGALLLSFVALMQGPRFALSWPASINGFAVPLWFSAIAFLALGWIAVGLWRESRR